MTTKLIESLLALIIGGCLSGCMTTIRVQFQLDKQLPAAKAIE